MVLASNVRGSIEHETHSWVLFGSLAQRKMKGRTGVRLPGGLLRLGGGMAHLCFKPEWDLYIQRHSSLMSGASAGYEGVVPAPGEGPLST